MMRFFERLNGVADVQPILGLFFGGALLAVLLTAWFSGENAPTGPERPSLWWTLLRLCRRWTWAVALVVVLVVALAQLRNYLHQTLGNFERNHGRVTQANYNAVQGIWGSEQSQAELRTSMYWDEEIVERLESEDITKPAVLRKKMVRNYVTSNPYLSEKHDVTLIQNPRQKGSAFYDGYETSCAFSWRLRNPSERSLRVVLTFPLPSSSGVYDDLSATLDGVDVLAQMELNEGALILTRDWQAGEAHDLRVSFKSRGMAYWYFQIKDSREIRDFTLTLSLPDLPKSKLNYPGGCMTPTKLEPTADNRGAVLTYRLDRAITNKGMGIALPTLPQPGATTSAVLEEIERAWLLIFCLLILGLTLAGIPYAVLWSVLFAAAIAFAYGLLGDFSDLLHGFWPTAGLILVPAIGLLAWLLQKLVPGREGRRLA